jgi:hypothetical protein
VSADPDEVLAYFRLSAGKKPAIEFPDTYRPQVSEPPAGGAIYRALHDDDASPDR